MPAPQPPSGRPSLKSPPATDPDRFFRPVSVADEALLEIVDNLREGLYPSGSSLPPLQELSRLLGISVTNVRAALQRLESAGVVQVRRGRGGGVTVLALDNLSSALRSLFKPVPDTQLPALVEAWTTLEREIYLLAAQRATQEDLDRLAVIVQELHGEQTQSPVVFQELTFRVHTVAATTARNPFLKRYFSTLMNMLGAVFAGRGNLAQVTPSRRQRILAQYDALVDAVARKDSDAISDIVQERATLQTEMMGLPPAAR